MSSTSINVGEFGIDSVGSERSLLTARPDMRIVKSGFLAAASIAVAGAVVYLLPISESMKAAFLPLAGLFVVTVAYSAIMYETLGNALFTLTDVYIEERGGVIWRSQHRIPLSYIRDVSYSQTILQEMFGVSSVTVSPTNGRKIVLSNVRDGERMREAIWKLVLSKSPSS